MNRKKIQNTVFQYDDNAQRIDPPLSQDFFFFSQQLVAAPAMIDDGR